MKSLLTIVVNSFEAVAHMLRNHAVEAGIPTEGLPAHHFVWFTTLLLKADQELARFTSR